MIVYTPVGEEDRALLVRVLAEPSRHGGCPTHRVA